MKDKIILILVKNGRNTIKSIIYSSIKDGEKLPPIRLIRFDKLSRGKEFPKPG